MANTYSGDPSTSDKDAVRFFLSDTGIGGKPWLFTDEEILWALEEHGNPYGAAAELAIIQSAKYTDRRDKTVGPLSIKYGEIADRWLKLAESLKQRAGRAGGAIAITTQKKRPPHIRLGMHDNHHGTTYGFDDPRALLGEEQ